MFSKKIKNLERKAPLNHVFHLRILIWVLLAGLLLSGVTTGATYYLDANVVGGEVDPSGARGPQFIDLYLYHIREPYRQK